MSSYSGWCQGRCQVEDRGQGCGCDNSNARSGRAWVAPAGGI